MGVSLPSQHHSHSLQFYGDASKQHQLPGHFYDQCWTVLCGASDLRQHGDVPGGAAAVSSRQSVSLHLWLLCGVSYVPGDCHCCSGPWLADLLQQEAAGPVVHLHTGEEEKVMLFKQCYLKRLQTSSTYKLWPIWNTFTTQVKPLS